MYIGTPVVIALCRLFPRQARWFTLAGLFVASLAMALSSFCTTVPQLLGVQGVLFGAAGCLAYSPCVLYIDEWFVRRKGMAYGIMWSAPPGGGSAASSSLCCSKACWAASGSQPPCASSPASCSRPRRRWPCSLNRGCRTRRVLVRAYGPSTWLM